MRERAAIANSGILQPSKRQEDKNDEKRDATFLCGQRNL